MLAAQFAPHANLTLDRQARARYGLKMRRSLFLMSAPARDAIFSTVAWWRRRRRRLRRWRLRCVSASFIANKSRSAAAAAFILYESLAIYGGAVERMLIICCVHVCRVCGICRLLRASLVCICICVCQCIQEERRRIRCVL